MDIIRIEFLISVHSEIIGGSKKLSINAFELSAENFIEKIAATWDLTLAELEEIEFKCTWTSGPAIMPVEALAISFRGIEDFSKAQATIQRELSKGDYVPNGRAVVGVRLYPVLRI